MKAHVIKISGRWGHFRRPEANNNPISYDFIPKTSLIGLMGAVIGLKRDELKQKYTELCQSVLYTMELCNPIIKFSSQFRIYKYKGSLTGLENPPQAYEILKNPCYKIIIFGKHNLFDLFIKQVINKNAYFTPTLGLVNCPANIDYIEEIELHKNSKSEVYTRGLIPKLCNLYIDDNSSNISYDSIPTEQNNDWFNTKYEEFYYGHFSDDSVYIKSSIPKEGYENTYTKQDSNESYFFI